MKKKELDLVLISNIDFPPPTDKWALAVGNQQFRPFECLWNAALDAVQLIVSSCWRGI